eukprot:CAMPEP_0171672516 /NCGR_PEP_ID=MMETSP0990-20121206/52035_1 /TAXON_ID=483369 /ORGANISM="non described non described, Strain CCMP2098" /LENGTH=86 /DNA_ID=CAMNT_0012257819 /DNA_START=457 /DNA_END=714 /DNA_ORIENTATION=-
MLASASPKKRKEASGRMTSIEKPSSYLVPDSSFGRRSTGSKKMTLNIGTINAGQISNNNNSNRHHISVEESPPKVQGVLPLPKKSP